MYYKKMLSGNPPLHFKIPNANVYFGTGDTGDEMLLLSWI